MTLLIAICASQPARTAGIEKLLMPGPVSEAHAKTEEQCEACHDRSDKNRQSALCLDCHKDTAVDVSGGKGFHGRMPGARTGQCQACHTEHRGRKADIVRLNRTSFDHHLTDFVLKGAHLTLACDGCHRPGTAFRKTSSSCVGCHREDDRHRGALGTQCQSCHVEESWRETRFDHDRTQFPLRNKHVDVPCAACHAGERYKNTPRQCTACHAPDDVHRGDRGAECGNCHTTAGWTTQKFDHARETGFALMGEHRLLECTDCHRTGKMSDPLQRDCIGCHRSDDRHAARFAERCNDCHGNETWRLETFDHLLKTKFALEGAHTKVTCHRCHTSVVGEQKLGTACAGCHQADDVHGGALGTSCESCHGTTDWTTGLSFDHDLTDFPLVGLHVVPACGQCHETLGFKGAPGECNGCHARNDVHKGGLGTDCDSCHSPNGWNLWEFDHGARTRFALTGAHKPLACADCHVKPASVVKISRDCASCHARDDIHSGQFGRQCQQCHNTNTFRRARVNQ